MIDKPKSVPLPKIKFDLPPDFADRFPDGDYTIGPKQKPKPKAKEENDGR